MGQKFRLLGRCPADARPMLEDYSNPIRFRRFGEPREAKKARKGKESKQKQATASNSKQRQAKASKKQANGPNI